MLPIRTGPDLLKQLSPIPDKKVVAVTIKGMALVDAVEPFILRELRIHEALKGYLIGFRGSFGVLKEPPVDMLRVTLQPLGDNVLLLYKNFAGIFQPNETVSFSKEIETGERLIALDPGLLISSEGKYGFTTLEEAPTDTDCQEKLKQLQVENSRLREENTALRQQLVEIPSLRLLIDQLKDTINARDNEILELNARIQQMIETTKRTPDDFATAVSDSVDKLQTRLSNMPNKISDFVVREFDLEAKVYIDVNEEGEIDYRFIQPGDNVDPLKVSNLTLKLAPVPKPESPEPAPDPTPTPTLAPAPRSSVPLPGSDIGVERLVGEGGEAREKLSRNNIHTLADFLQVATRARTLAQLSSMLEIDRQRLGNWVIQAQLMTISGISAAMAQVLIDLGMASLKILAGADPAALLAQYNTAAAAQTLPAATIEDAQRWIATAKLAVGG